MASSREEEPAAPASPPSAAAAAEVPGGSRPTAAAEDAAAASETRAIPAPASDASAAASGLPRRRVVRRSKRGGGGASRRTGGSASSGVPDSISRNPALLRAIPSGLPADYDFEIPKTLHRIRQLGARHVALQMPEGLLMYALSVADLLRRFASPGCCESVSVLGDVTYGACCVDDLGARALGADLLVHYGHSCLVPVGETAVRCLYVFVEIRIDVRHAVECLCETCGEGTRVHVMGTVQFRTAVVEAARLLNERNRPASIPQAKPLSPGEVLGCTAPAGLARPSSGGGSGTKDDDGGGGREGGEEPEEVMLFLADGRFHLEAAMIANPTLRALRYDPYSKTLTDEKYEVDRMKSIRRSAVRAAQRPDAEVFGIILGTLGQQGNPTLLGRIRSLLRSRGRRHFVLLLSEIFPAKLAAFPNVDVWVQIACPRLSVDWGHFFDRPLLSAFELMAAMGEAELGEGDAEAAYPMDYYRTGSGRWTNYHEENRSRRIKAT